MTQKWAEQDWVDEIPEYLWFVSLLYCRACKEAWYVSKGGFLSIRPAVDSPASIFLVHLNAKGETGKGRFEARARVEHSHIYRQPSLRFFLAAAVAAAAVAVAAGRGTG